VSLRTVGSILGWWISGGLLILVACTFGGAERPPPTGFPPSIEAPVVTEEVTEDQFPQPGPANPLGDSSIPKPVETNASSPEDAPPRGAELQFSTDFSKHSVPYIEILSGGPPKDGIPAIDDPKFVDVEEAEGWLENLEPVAFIEIEGDARAYPLQILTWHEIVNDTVGGVPVTVTFCPLCNTAIAFERT